MKHNQLILILKGVCFVIVGAFTPWTSALAQWASEGTWPNKIIWVGVILPASLVGSASALLGFLNNSYSDYTANKDSTTTTTTVSVDKPKE